MKNLDSIIKKHLSSLKEEQIMENYMFFSNLKQMHRQCELLLELDPSVVESIFKKMVTIGLTTILVLLKKMLTKCSIF